MGHALSSSRLEAESLESFKRDGFLLVRGVFDPAEMVMAAMEAERLLGQDNLKQMNNIRCRWKNHNATGECLFECFDPVIDISPVFKQIAYDPRLLDLVAELYGEPAHVFKDKLIFKPPGAFGYDLHQDFIGWPDFPQSFLTAAVAIDPCAKENGATEFFPGVHKRGYLSPRDGDYHHCPTEAVNEAEGVVVELQPGDVVFFGCFVPHRSAPNQSDSWRRLFYLSYNSQSDGGERRQAHYDEFHHWLKKKYAEYGKHETYFQ